MNVGVPLRTLTWRKSGRYAPLFDSKSTRQTVSGGDVERERPLLARLEHDGASLRAGERSRSFGAFFGSVTGSRSVAAGRRAHLEPAVVREPAVEEAAGDEHGELGRAVRAPEVEGRRVRDPVAFRNSANTE